MALADNDKPKDVKVFVRGDPGTQGELAPRRFLEIASGTSRALFSVNLGAPDVEPLGVRFLGDAFLFQDCGLDGLEALEVLHPDDVVGADHGHQFTVDALVEGFHVCHETSIHLSCTTIHPPHRHDQY